MSPNRRFFNRLNIKTNKLIINILSKAHSHLIIAAVALVGLLLALIYPYSTQASDPNLDPAYLSTSLNLTTDSRFWISEEHQTESILFDVEKREDSDLDWGVTNVIQEGKNGTKTTIYQISYFDQEVFEREAIDVQIEPAQNEIVAIGTKRQSGEVDTPSGKLKFKGKLRVWATSYDPFCAGCNDTTAIGMKAGFGVIAVDPKIIPLKSKVYIPGYGEAIAGDTGGAIKGNKIDLGFDNVKNGWWSSRYTDIYLLE